MPTKSINQIVEDELTGPHALAWADAIATAVSESLGRHASAIIDIASATPASAWRNLDDPVYRSRIAEQDPLLASRITGLLAGVIDPIRDAIVADGYGRQTVASMTRRLQPIVTRLMTRPTAVAALTASPFADNWAFVGNAIAIRLHSTFGSTLLDRREDEWLIMNHLILAEYFRQCILPEAALVENELVEARRGILSVRGTLVCTANEISPTGLGVDPIRICTFQGGINLHHEPLSSLLEAIGSESRQVAAGHGVMHRMAAHLLASPTEVRGGEHIPPAMFRAARTRSFPRYEHSMNAYMGLAAIEQLARSCAQQNGINHVRPGGIPSSVENWIHRLPCAPAVIDSVRNLFSGEESNLRNRIMHSGFLLTEGGSLIESLAIANPGRFGPIAARPRSYTPPTIAHLILECLRDLDADIHARRPLAPPDFSWTQMWQLTPQEIQFGRQVYCDLIPRPNGPTRESALEWQLYLSRYFSALMPGLGQFFRMAYNGLMARFSANSFPLLHSLGMTFEAIYRLSAHLIGIRVLGNTASGSSWFFQYRMLDEDGLHGQDSIDRIVDYLEPHERDNAREILRLAVKTRNALAHGCVVLYDDPTHLGMMHILMKATQLLVGAGEHHMTRECAWYRWHDLHPDQDGRDEEDWFVAEPQILAMIESTGKPRTRRTWPIPNN